MSAAVLAGVAVLAGCLAVRGVLVAGDRSVVLRGARWRPTPPSWVTTALADAAIALDPGRAWRGWMAVVATATVVGLAAGGAPLAMVAGVLAGAAPAVVVRALGGRALAAVDAALPDVLDAVGRSLRSGATVRVALAELAPARSGRLGADLAVVVAEAEGGVPLVQAFDGWADRCPTPGVRLAVAALALSAGAGGAAARAIDGVAETLRSNLAVAGEIRAQSAQARMSAMVIALAPLAFGALGAGTDRRTATFLLRTPFGLACLVTGIALDAVAAWWMHRISAAPA